MHPIACPACGHRTHAPEGAREDWQFCPNCGRTLPELPESSITHADIEGKTAVQPLNPPLWNPIVITVLGIPLGFVFSSVLVALNWHSLKKHWFAGMAWTFAIIFGLIVQQPLLELVPGPWPFVLGAFIWFPVLGLTQLQYIRKHLRSQYPKRSWLVPVSLGVAAQAVVFIWAVYDQRHPSADTGLVTPTNQTSRQEYTPQELFQSVGPAVVEVKTTWREPFLLFFSQVSRKCSST